MTVPSFLELPNAPLEEAHVVVVCAPYEGTVSYGKGTAAAPEAILQASLHLETFDEELAFEHEGNLRYCVLPAVTAEENGPVERYLKRLSRTVAGQFLHRAGDGQFPRADDASPVHSRARLPLFLGLGGEHSVSGAFLEGIPVDPSEVTVVQIDAHADLREEYRGSRFDHACAMRRVLDLGVKRMVAIGIRSAEEEEFFLAASDPRIESWYDHRIESEEGFAALLGALREIEGPVYLTVDIDGFEPGLCPGTGTPQPGGLSWLRTLAVLRALIREDEHEGKAELLGADICEVVAQPNSQVNEMVAAKLAFKIASYRFAPAG